MTSLIRYHSMEHVEALLARIEALEARGLLQHPLLVKLAAFFHDAVYNPSASHNEMRSAEMWRRFGACATKLTPDDVDIVAGHIERTATHFKADAKADLAHFLDADIAVLGLPPNAYAEYARQVRLEYAHASVGH